MKFFILIFSCLILSACSKNSMFDTNPDNTPDRSQQNLTGGDNSNTADDTDDDTTLIEPTEPSDIKVVASREYNPSSWNHFSTTIDFTATMEVPADLALSMGNSGTGWASITIGGRKFCYQGNASNNNTPDGTLFIFKREKTDITVPCHSSANNDATFNPQVAVAADDTVQVEVHGGGCASVCEQTEIDFDLIVIE